MSIQSLRVRLLLRDGDRCHYCTVVMLDPGEPDRALAEYPGLEPEFVAHLRSCVAEVEHLVPRAVGGSDALRNLVLACRRCNQRKGAKPYGLFAMSRDHQGERMRELMVGG